MKHEHLPALNKYTSKPQYEAMQEIDKSSSIINIISQGRMGTTLGALLRSAWVDSEVLTDAQGMTSERWFVTDAGKHAMQLYELKRLQDEQKAKAAAEAQRIMREAREQQLQAKQEAFDKLLAYYETKKKHQDALHVMWPDVSNALERALVSRDEFERMQRSAKIRAGLEKPVFVSDLRNDQRW